MSCVITLMLEKQRELNDQIDFGKLSSGGRDNWLDIFSSGVIEEAVEFRKSCRHKKFWKEHYSPINISGVYEEFADMMSHLINIALVLELDENQIKEIFLEKYNVNMRRKREGC